MNKKQFIISFVTICLFVGILTGCNKTGDKQANTGNNAETEVTETPTEGAVEKEASVTPANVQVTEAAKQTSGWQVIKSFNYDFPVYKTAFYSADFGFTAGLSGEIHYTPDQGDTWPRAENSTACLFGIDIVNENVAYVTGNSSDSAKTTDGGKTWTAITDFVGSNTDHCFLVSFFDETTGLIANDKKLGYTKDSGTTWTEVTPPANIKAIHLTTATKGYVVGMDKKLYVTDDAGASWKAQDLAIEGFENNLDLPQTCAFSIAEDGTGILFYLEKEGVVKCFETKDSAVTWTKSAEFSIKDTIKSPYMLYLSRDNKYLTAQNLTGSMAALISYVE